ncbi:MAG: Asp-tRNA(Asn)/Glu-tRNA(Gln) amidotransferase subunit GatC [Gammaproteobacteria bacterium]|nr:Asp-tRNA(Asn)/Glu-tRNA(Gln) amidotransferase subunit GatC [Gammaproteobacteria bacterium]
MPLTLNELARLEELAALSLPIAQKELVLDQLNAFFHYVERISAIDTREVPALTHPIAVFEEVFLQLQEDIPQEGLALASLQANAPAFIQNYFVVPKVVD